MLSLLLLIWVAFVVNMVCCCSRDLLTKRAMAILQIIVMATMLEHVGDGD
jgi:hypothetical protein